MSESLRSGELRKWDFTSVHWHITRISTGKFVIVSQVPKLTFSIICCQTFPVFR